MKRKSIKYLLRKVENKVFDAAEAYALTSVALLVIARWYIVTNIIKPKKKKKKRGKNA